jgi:transposase-like protein
MKRPALDTLACVNPACQRFRRTDEGHLTVRKVYGHAHLRLRRCRTCGEAFSERRGSALCNTKIAEEKAAAVINHVDEGGGVRATARLVQVSQDTVARLLRRAGRHAERCHDRHGRDLPPRALAFDAQGSCVQESRSVAKRTRLRRPVTCGTLLRSPPTASSWCLWWSVNARRNRPIPWGKIPSVVSGRGICRRASRMPPTATRQPSSRPLGVATLGAQTRERRAPLPAAAALAPRVGLGAREKHL